MTTLTTSPPVNGWSRKIVNDPNKFSKLSFEAIAIAIPPTPSPAASAVIFTLKIFPIIRNPPRISIIIFKESVANGISWSSNLDSVFSVFFLSISPK